MKLVDKTAVVAEIEKRKNENLECATKAGRGYFSARAMEDIDILSFLDTIKAEDVDLKNELKEDWLLSDKAEVDCLECMCLTEDMFVSLAKKYFQLGLKAQKGEKV